jgi:hypothetical protein
MFGSIFLMTCLGCLWIGMTHLTRYRCSPSPDPTLLGESIMGFLGSAVNLVAAAVSFFQS